MKVGLIPVNIGVARVEDMVGMAQLAEAGNYESVWTFEHVMVPEEYESRYPYSPSGKMGGAPDNNFVDPLIALTAIAAQTEKLRLGTGVNILSQSNPLYLAKQAASLDFVSGGRLMLGLGIGWLREEFNAMGVPFERRGARFDDYVQAMNKVWSGETVEHRSEFLNWSGFKSYPIPIRGRIPIVIGGSKGRIVQRIARLGDGWFAPPVDPDEFPRVLADVKAECDKIGRDFSEIEITTIWNPKGGLESVQELQAAGMHRVLVPAFALGANPAERIQQISEEVIARL